MKSPATPPALPYFHGTVTAEAQTVSRGSAGSAPCAAAAPQRRTAWGEFLPASCKGTPPAVYW